MPTNDREDDEGTLKLCGSVEQGILAALSACLETVEVHTLNVGTSWTTSTKRSRAEQQTIGKAQAKHAQMRAIRRGDGCWPHRIERWSLQQLFLLERNGQ